MNHLMKVALCIGLLVSAAPAVFAKTFQCQQATCLVRLKNPETGGWLPPEVLPRGTIVDTAWGMPYGEGWAPI